MVTPIIFFLGKKRNNLINDYNTIMEINDFIQKFADQLDDTDVSQLAPETEFRELDEWTSIVGLSIILMVDEEYGITLEAADVQKANTIEELFNIVQAKA